MGIAALFTQTVSVRTKTGQGARGPAFADAVDVRAFVNDQRQVVRAETGEEVVSETTLYAPLADLDVFAVQSLVTVNGRSTEVLAAYRRDSAGPASVHHCQVVLK